VTYFGSNPNPTLSASNTSSNEIRNSANESNNTSKAVTEDQFATEIAEILGNFTPRSRIESASMAAPYAPTLPALNADSIPSSATINSIEDIGAGRITERNGAVAFAPLINPSISLNGSSTNINNDILFNEFAQNSALTTPMDGKRSISRNWGHRYLIAVCQMIKLN
jgi:hypothetical protein